MLQQAQRVEIVPCIVSRTFCTLSACSAVEGKNSCDELSTSSIIYLLCKPFIVSHMQNIFSGTAIQSGRFYTRCL